MACEFLRRREQIEAHVLERAAAGACGVGAVRLATVQSPVGGSERGIEMKSDQSAQAGAGAEDRIRVDVAPDLAGDIGLARRGQRLGDEGRLKCVVGENSGERIEQPFIHLRFLVRAQPRDIADQHRGRQRLHRLPAIERIAVARRQRTQIVRGEIGDELDRRGEAAIGRQRRPLRNVGEDKTLRRLVENQHPTLDVLAIRELERQCHGRRGRPSR